MISSDADDDDDGYDRYQFKVSMSMDGKTATVTLYATEYFTKEMIITCLRCIADEIEEEADQDHGETYQ